MIRLVRTDCWGCRYNGWDGICKKDGVCNGVESYPTYATTSTSPLNIPKSEMPYEIEINGIKYRRVDND